jgi:polyvinyl alcohol dehydrogenase (cytochrome)
VLGSTDEFQVGVSEFDGPREGMPGAGLYQAHCATCHNGTVAKAPHFSWLEMMPAKTLMAAMSDGIMKTQSAALSDEQRVHITEYLTRRRYRGDAEDDLAGLYCEGDAANFDFERSPAKVSWGHDTKRFVPAEVAGFAARQIPDLELQWTFVFPDALRARSNPAIGYGAVFVGSQDGRVYALDLASGCVRWAYQAAAEVRTGVVAAELDGKPTLFFGDILAWLYAVDAVTGELRWSQKVDPHPSATLTATPALHDGTLYVAVSSLEVTPAADPNYDCCTFRGSVQAVDAASGEVRWVSYTIPDEPKAVGTTAAGATVYSPSGVPTWTSPAIDVKRNRLYVGTGENYSSPADGNSDAVLAIDLDTGARVWTRQITAGDAWNVACMMADNPNCPAEDGPDFDIGNSQLLARVGDRDVLLIGHKMGAAFALDPDDPTEFLWQARVGRGTIQGGVHFGMALEGETLYVPINDMNDTRNGDVLDPEAARPGVHAINVRDGSVRWSEVAVDRCGVDRPFCDPGISAAVTAMPGAVFAGHLDGMLRAYAKDSGAVLWEFDAARDLVGVGGRKGRGGSMSGGGPAIGDGYVVASSGYGLYFHEPGNVLLAFAPRRPVDKTSDGE